MKEMFHSCKLCGEETKGWIHKVNRKRSWHTDDDEFEGEEENVKEFVNNCKKKFQFKFMWKWKGREK